METTLSIIRIPTGNVEYGHTLPGYGRVVGITITRDGYRFTCSDGKTRIQTRVRPTFSLSAILCTS